jgi:2-dehydro-3-deoxygluconokinase
MMDKVFCFGEFLLRMSPVLNRKWLHDATIPVYIGGAELNVATALSKWKVPVKYCSALPVNFLSHDIIEELEAKNIDTTPIHFSGSRIGVYYLQQGADLKKVDVIYDRANSSFSELRTGMINWDEVLNGCSWFHFSAISPALSEATAELCQEALQAASAKGLTISIDLNYRSKLWQYGKQPEEIMPALLKHCHVVMGNIWAAESLLGIKSGIKVSTGKSTEELIAGAAESMQNLQENFPSVTTIAYTFRLEERYFALLQHDNKLYKSKEFSQTNIIDRVGSGDCFMAGLIYGLHNHNLLQEIIDFSGAAAIGKMQEKGDATNQTIEEVKQRFNQNE